MDSGILSVHKLFKDYRRFMVPFYQRLYVWTQCNQWERLWEDIQIKADARLQGGKTPPHFLGTIVLDKQENEGVIGVDTFHIVDGQQRLTTLQYVLKAAIMSLNSVNAKQQASLLEKYVINSHSVARSHPDSESYKVWPTYRDREEYEKAMRALDRLDLRKKFQESFTQSGNLRVRGVSHPSALAALWFFTDKFNQWINQDVEETPERKSEALSSAILFDLAVVSITLGEADDAQVIFETLNGYGARLTATDLIRNFIFMQAEKEGADGQELYDSLWHDFDSIYWNTAFRRGRSNKPLLEWLIQAILQTELRDEVDLGRLYAEYRRYVFNNGKVKAVKDQLATLVAYASHYRQLIDQTGTTPIADFGRRISCFDITTLHPLALMISVAEIPDDSKTEMYNLIVSYVTRRAKCGLTSRNYNHVFFSILRSLARTAVTPVLLQECFDNLKGDGSRWPGGTES